MHNDDSVDATLANLLSATDKTYTATPVSAINNSGSCSIAVNTIGISEYDDFYILKNIAYHLNEDELLSLLDKLKTRGMDIRCFVRFLVKNRHFSEGFLLKNIEYLYKQDILQLHKADLLSGSYQQVNLFYEAKQ